MRYLSLPIHHTDVDKLTKAAYDLLSNFGVMVEPSEPLGNGSGYCQVRIITNNCPYSDAEIGFKLGATLNQVII
jgi:hypothetical protein